MLCGLQQLVCSSRTAVAWVCCLGLGAGGCSSAMCGGMLPFTANAIHSGADVMHGSFGMNCCVAKHVKGRITASALSMPHGAVLACSTPVACLYACKAPSHRQAAASCCSGSIWCSASWRFCQCHCQCNSQKAVAKAWLSPAPSGTHMWFLM